MVDVTNANLNATGESRIEGGESREGIEESRKEIEGSRIGIGESEIATEIGGRSEDVKMRRDVSCVFVKGNFDVT